MTDQSERERRKANRQTRKTATQKQSGPRQAGRLIHSPEAVCAGSYFRSSGTVPPDAISFSITFLCSQMFISAEPSSAPV
jgi:hypothetical protein